MGNTISGGIGKPLEEEACKIKKLNLPLIIGSLVIALILAVILFPRCLYFKKSIQYTTNYFFS